MNRYEIVRTIGRGGNGLVLLCRQKDMPDMQLVVVKQIPIDMMSQVDRASAIRTFPYVVFLIYLTSGEAKMLQTLTHPNIIGYYDSFIDMNAMCIVMQYAEGSFCLDNISS
jgi:serine/threonine protein kinase